MSKLTTVLVIGMGSIGQRHARLLAERRDVALWICDAATVRLDETRARLAGSAFEAFTSLEEALARRPEAAFVCTPDASHVPLGLKVLGAGADLFVEKPIADSVSAAEQLVAAAEKQGRMLHVGYMLRNDTGIQQVHKLVHEGAIGNVVGARAMVGTYLTLLNAKDPYRVQKPDTLPIDYTHEIDYLRWLFGPVRDVVARGASVGKVDLKPTPNVFQMLLTMESGALVQVHMDYVQHPQRRTLEVYGDRGTLGYDFMSGELRKYPYGLPHVWETQLFGPIGGRVDDLYRQQINEFLRRRGERTAAAVTGRDALETLRLASQAIASAHAGR